ncbi:MAG: DUF5060 domain-containing protein [Candidatus Omnitrophica bacterium]|nr:DUF5060 domain-containing protein [Candidatus Omnitrophota bacterium]
MIRSHARFALATLALLGPEIMSRAENLLPSSASPKEEVARLDQTRAADKLPPLAISDVQEDSDPLERFSRFEARFSLNRSFSSAEPFDPDIIDAGAVITTPTGEEILIPAFYTQDYTIGNPAYESYTPLGAPYWKVRFTPCEVGVHSYFLRARDQTGETQTEVFTFEALPSTRKGFVRRHPHNPLALAYDDGSLYFPIGHNIAFGDGIPANLNGTAYYSALFSGLAASRGNWSRVWMTDFERSALEWSSAHFSGFYNGVGAYSLQAAFRVEKILELAELHGLSIQLVLNDHGQFSTWVNARWSDNPYNQARGGPVPSGNPEQFFSDPTARDLHKRRLRYIVARYGAFPSILAWELFNEVQFAGRSDANWYTSAAIRNSIRDWHIEMAARLKALDRFRHPVTTSSDTSNFNLLWSLGDIDIPQIHDYSAPSSERDLLIRSQVTALQTAHAKPVIVGELGLDASGADECNFNPTTYSGSTANRDHLVQGTHIHNAIWAAAIARSCAASWWWGCYLERDPSRSRTGPTFPLHTLHYPALAAFLEGFPLEDPTLANSSVSAPPTVAAFGLASDNQALAWIRDVQNAFNSGVGPGNLPPQRTLSGVSITIPELANESYRVEFFDPWSGNHLSGIDLVAGGGAGLTFTLPDFQRDIAVKVTRNATAISQWQIY